MQLRTGNLWDAPAEVGATLIGVTTNSYVHRDGPRPGPLAMGAGAALEAHQRYPGLPLAAGVHLRHVVGFRPGLYGVLPRYGWAVVPEPRIGLFQTKYHYRQNSDTKLIKFSVLRLSRWLRANLAEVVALNFPGIGYGRLTREVVLPLLEPLPERVYIYERS